MELLLPVPVLAPVLVDVPLALVTLVVAELAWVVVWPP